MSMDLYPSIFKRMSCRDFDMEPLTNEMLERIDHAISDFEHLYPDTPLEHRLASKTVGKYRVDAPHYMVISGKGKNGEFENAGFVFQQLVLWLDANDIGSVWLGLTKDVETNKNGKDIITLAFGRPNGKVHRTLDEFKRRSIEEITNDPCEMTEAVRLAPSGMNIQPWYFLRSGEEMNVYRQNPKLPFSLVYKLTDVDIGIALSHYALACEHFGKEFKFRRDSSAPKRKGYEHFGVIL